MQQVHWGGVDTRWRSHNFPLRKPYQLIMTRMTETLDPGIPKGKIFRVGTLSYNKASLFSLFLWLLLGDFCLILVAWTAVPAVLQVNLNQMGASNWVLGLILTTIPNLLNVVVNPVASFRSDRYRSRWGRRIPFLLVATLPLTLFLGLIGFSRQIGSALHALIHPGATELGLTLVVVGVLVFGFQLLRLQRRGSHRGFITLHVVAADCERSRRGGVQLVFSQVCRNAHDGDLPDCRRPLWHRFFVDVLAGQRGAISTPAAKFRRTPGLCRGNQNLL